MVTVRPRSLGKMRRSASSEGFETQQKIASGDERRTMLNAVFTTSTLSNMSASVIGIASWKRAMWRVPGLTLIGRGSDVTRKS